LLFKPASPRRTLPGRAPPGLSMPCLPCLSTPRLAQPFLALPAWPHLASPVRAMPCPACRAKRCLRSSPPHLPVKMLHQIGGVGISQFGIAECDFLRVAPVVLNEVIPLRIVLTFTEHAE